MYDLQGGEYTWVMGEGPDPAMGVALLPLSDGGDAAREALVERAVLTFSDSEHELTDGGTIPVGETLTQLVLNENRETRFKAWVEQAGLYTLFTEHHPNEFGAALHSADGALDAAHIREYKPDHEHVDELTSVGITIPSDLDGDRLNRWLSTLLRTQGQDIFRMKGVLSIQGQPERYVFQGVHMLFDGRPDRPWGAEPRHNALIFIGRNLNRAALNQSFRACLA